ncbi:MAG: hypothetical protein ABTD50_23925 [Polyangiaceae bacterium]|jgi:hypothetical protein
MGSALGPISLVPVDRAATDPATTFGEVIAYLHGIADAMSTGVEPRISTSLLPKMAATDGRSRHLPLSLSPSRGPVSLAPLIEPTERVTLPFGELPIERASAWPDVVVGSSSEPTRGGSRVLDLSTAPPSSPAIGVRGPFLHTLPYQAPSLVPSAACAVRVLTVPPENGWLGTRSSEVRLRAGHLSAEWYELTDTVTFREAAANSTPASVERCGEDSEVPLKQIAGQG